ncbi:ABC transporter ATP-binding protein [Methanobrevibacter sp.]|uniref:ABC transporter ATP-binding protein n=1 Tax=Methanobrevibacter sp. TaxID=66852 RepID=UPI0038703F92
MTPKRLFKKKNNKHSLKSSINKNNANNLQSDSQNKMKLTKEESAYLNKQSSALKNNNEVAPIPKQQKKRNVDEYLEELIPNYSKEISVELNHADLTFTVKTEKVDTLKETIIRIFRHNKTSKMKIHALNDVSFKLYQGEKVGIIGYNGAGKSTLLNVITGIYPIDKGSVKTSGNISPLLSLGAGFDYNYTGRQNIYLNGAVLGYDKKFLQKKENEIIEFSELGEFIDIPIKNYSSGMLAKLGFSIATAVNPDILIIDEILGVGDVNFQRKSSDKIRSLMNDGTTVLLVSHSIPQIRNLCDKAIWINKGKIKEIGEVNKVCDNYLKDSKNANAQQLKNIKFN